MTIMMMMMMIIIIIIIVIIMIITAIIMIIIIIINNNNIVKIIQFLKMFIIRDLAQEYGQLCITLSRHINYIEETNLILNCRTFISLFPKLSSLKVDARP